MKVPKVQKTSDGRVASKIETGLQAIPRDNVPSIKGIADGFATDAWLANWDAVGLAYDNIKSKGGTAMRIDAGGALRYRAMGAPKGAAFGKKVGEVKTLRSRSMNPQASRIFNKFSDKQLKAGAKRVTGIPDSQIQSIVRSSISNPKTARTLSETLIARKESLRTWRVATLWQHVRPVEEAQAQLRSVEWLTAQPTRAEIDSIGSRMPSDSPSSVRTIACPTQDAPSESGI